MECLLRRVICPLNISLARRHVLLARTSRHNLTTSEGKIEQDKPASSESKEPSDKSKRIAKHNVVNDRSPITFKSLAIGGTFILGLTFLFQFLRNEKKRKQEIERSRSFGQAAIGGKFELLDKDGKLRTSDEFLGKWLLIYFGFTNCPDVCPEELEKLSIVIENLEKKKIKITPLFISVDPERDTPELIEKYLLEFSDKFIGLTGSKEQVQKATKAYRIYYSVGPKDKDNDYIVDHTIISYLVNPKGDLVDYYGRTKEADEIEKSVMVNMKLYNDS